LLLLKKTFAFTEEKPLLLLNKTLAFVEENLSFC